MPCSRVRFEKILVLLLPAGLAVWAATASAELQIHVSPDGQERNICFCRPASDIERQNPALSPDGWVQDAERESFNRGTVPLPIVPDFVGTRTRAAGALVWGDADSDGDSDLFVGTYYGNMWPPLEDYFNFIYLNSGTMLENDPSWVSSDERHTTDAKWGPINDDLHPDLFVANGGSSIHPSQVFYGQDGPLPTTAGWASSDNCWTISCALCDFDSDGDTDVATANQGNTGNPYRPTHLFRNLGDALETVPSWQSSQVGITNGADWGDMNGDSLPDLAVSGWSNWASGVFLNTGTSLETGFAWTTGHPERTDKGIGWSRVDDDPHPDLAIGGNGDPDWIFRNEGVMLGALPYWESAESFTGCQDLVWIDIDRDLDEDLALIHFSTGHVRLYLNEDGVLSTTADWQYDAASSGTAIAFGDVNGDRWPDLAVGVANGPILLFLNLTLPTGVEQTASDLPAPDRLRIRANPSPFAGELRIVLESGSPFRLDSVDLFDLSGRNVARILRRTDRFTRLHPLSWNPGEERVLSPSPGIYFVRARGEALDGRPLHATSKVVWLGS